MKCPLVWYQDYEKGVPSGFRYGDCLQEECAWWDVEDNCCCVYTIPLGILHIYKTLVEISQKMPKDLAPRG